MNARIIGFVLAFATAAACTSKKDTNKPDGDTAACTEEAKVCPDGSTVSRSGPACEFAECPAAAEPADDAKDGDAAAETPDAAPAADG